MGSMTRWWRWSEAKGGFIARRTGGRATERTALFMSGKLIYTQGAFPPLNLEPVHRVPPLAGYIREREASKCNSVYDLLRVGWALIRYVTDMFSRRLTAQQIRAIGQGYHERNQTAAARRQALAAGG